MNTQLYKYHTQRGWDTQPDPGLDSETSLLLVFSGLNDENLAGPLATLRAIFPKAIIIGCSTAGEIYDDELILDGLVTAVIRFDKTRLQLATRSQADTTDSYDAGIQIARSLDAEDLKAVFVLSEGLNVNGSQLIDGLNNVLGDKVVITGGLAGDGDRFEQTWVIAGHEQEELCICAVGLYSADLAVAHGSKGGWSLLGFEKEVTRSDGNILYELDGQPALEIYRKYLGERAQGLPSTGLLFPLALLDDTNKEEFRVRTILAIDEDTQSITFAGDIPQGGRVQLMHASMDRLIDGAAQAAAGIQLDKTNGSLPLSIAISCVGRRLVLGQRTEEEIESTLEQFPPGTRQIGFYSYGEISPLASGECDLHNQTMTLTLLQEF